MTEAKKISGEVSLIYKDRSANAKSPIGVLALAVQEGDFVDIRFEQDSDQIHFMEERLRQEGIIE